MKQAKGLIIKLSFLLMQFLIEFCFYLFIFSIPFLILMKFQSLLLVAIGAAIFGIVKISLPYISKKLINSNNSRMYFILGLTSEFLAIIILSKVMTMLTLLLAITLWAIAYNLLKYASLKLVSTSHKEIIGNWAYLYRPIRMSGLMFAPFIAAYLIFQNNINDVINYLGLLASLGAILYLCFFNKLARKEKKLTKEIFSFNKTTILTGFLYAYFWIYAPLAMYLEYDQFNQIPLVLLWLNLPYLLILVWKNIFKLNIWQLRPLAKAILIILALVIFGFSNNILVFILATVLLGIVLGLMQSSDAQEKNYQHNYFAHQINFGIGFVIAVLLGFVSVYNNNFSNGLITLAAIILVWVIYSKLKGRRKTKNFQK